MGNTTFIKPLKGGAFFSPVMLSELTARIERLTPQSPRQWGTMTPDQMLHHLNLATGSALGYFNLPDESNALSRSVVKWLLVDFPSKMAQGLGTAKSFTTTEHQYDFDYEKRLLLEILRKACTSETTATWGPHVLFGRMSDNEWGRLLTMHTDHHLRQFDI